MPRPLGPADSFNSSSATIVPDKKHDGVPNNVSSLSSARVLMPQDTLGRELESTLGSSEGQSSWSMVDALRSFSQLPPESQSQTNLESFLYKSNPDFSALLTNPSPSTSEFLAQLNIGSQPALPATSSPQVLFARQLAPEQEEHTPFRPTSARSHRSSISGSEWTDYSVTTTDMDTDDEPADVISPGAWDMRGPGAPTAQYPTPGSSTGGPSPPTVPGAITEPARDNKEEDELRKKRLEHRREINRRSAQKHRTRRREEVELLYKRITALEARNTQLEKELAVSKSNEAQLQSFVRLQFGTKKE